RTGRAAQCRRAAGSPSDASRSWLVIYLERLGAGLAVALEQHLHLLLGLAQRALAVAGEADALLEGVQRLFQGELATFQALDQLLQFGEGLLEIQGGFGAGSHDAVLERRNGRDTSRAGGQRQMRAYAGPWKRGLRPCADADQGVTVEASRVILRRRPSRSSKASCHRRPAAPGRAAAWAADVRPGRRRRSRRG